MLKSQITSFFALKVLLFAFFPVRRVSEKSYDTCTDLNIKLRVIIPLMNRGSWR